MSNSKVIKFLEEADDRYISAFETRSIGLLRGYFSRNCCQTISCWIVAEASSRFFGNKKYRKTEWKLVEQDGPIQVYLKSVIYKTIHIGLFKTMKVSEDYNETWVVDTDSDCVVDVAYA